ncbi:hypothetical protein B0H15DRAFT_37212 [Mycena belliarum]|uniref:Uncharacterized protein n=1 Tax=Mycena belliarum TaxID=1033014 RepID=A0AAD6XF17_9AGAR|nr:hypothetical protein B0H15DRAFT_37212 [Mycena belliae]
MLSSILVLVPFLAGINAANDWTVPCVKGQCSYDLPTTNGPSSGTMKIWGSNDAITDITRAADWQILDCDPKALSQNIRLVCMRDSDDPNSLCGHLYQNTGAVNKIVRLPENCGANAFARVSKAWVPEDQSIPASIKARLYRRAGTAPVVKALAIDTDFDQLDWTKNGKVNMAIHAANVPGAATDIEVPGSRRASRGSRRGLFDHITSKAAGIAGGIESEAGRIADGITSVAGGAASRATSVFGAATSAIDNAASKVVTAAGAIETALKGGGLNKTFTPDPLNVDKKVNLFNTSLPDCGPVAAGLSVDLDAKATAAPTVTISVTGSLVPPEVATFKAVAGMTANIQGTITVGAELSGHIDSGKILVFEAGIPGFDFPGFLSVGPSFQVNAQFVGDVDLQLDMTVGLNFDVKNAQLSFPPDDSKKLDSSAFSIGDTPLSLSASPSVKATGTLTAHLIPSLQLGLSIAGGKVAQANVFLELDTSAALILSLDASATITQPIAGNATANSTAATSTADTTADATATEVSSVIGVSAATSAADATAAASATDASAATTAATADATADVTATAPGATTTAVALAERADPTVSTEFGGCVQVVGGINVNAGADGKFFHLFDELKQVSLFSKNFEIFKKCFGNGAANAPTVTRRRMRRVARRERLQARALFSCPAAGVSPPKPVTTGTVASSSISEKTA